jgi:DNA-binding transcriptional MerR regulator
MRHLSIPSNQSCEFINVQSISPFISKCQIKVCYVGDEPNRNRNVITKEVATAMAGSLRGCPIVGKYNSTKKDFEEHNEFLKFENGKWGFVTDTVPYGFVDLNAKIWFQKFIDDNSVEREYLVTEGYIWTGQFPECQRCVTQGNNQSMELDRETLQGQWTKDERGEPQFFIINDGLFSKLCILGDDEEPCFEGSQINVHFSLNEDESFAQTLYSMMNELKTVLDEGGNNVENEVLTTVEEVVVEEAVATEDVVVEEEVTTLEENSEILDENGQTEEPEIEEQVEEEAPVVTEEVAVEVSYNLDDVVEYQDLMARYATLEADYNALMQTNAELNNQINSLTEFRNQVELQEKEAMIDSFYMLDDEDKADVRENINTYSLSDIESKLAVICFKKKVDFSIGQENEVVEEQPATTFNLATAPVQEDIIPSWLQAVDKVQKELL